MNESTTNPPSPLHLVATGESPDQHARYFDRDLSDLAYVERILDLARLPATPLAERVRFLGISCQVLDEFLAVRLLALGADARLPVLRGIDALQQAQQACLVELLALLEARGLLVDDSGFPGDVAAVRYEAFEEQLLPVLTPLTVDREHPLPFLQHRQLSLLLEVRRRGQEPGFLVLPLPDTLPDYVGGHGGRWLRVETVVAACARRLLAGQQVRAIVPFRVIRASDLPMAASFDDLREEVERTLAVRPRNPIAAVEVGAGASERALRFLRTSLIGDGALLTCNVPGVARFAGLQNLVEEHLRRLGNANDFYPPHAAHDLPALARCGGNLFDAMQRQDLILHWPYHGFDVQLDYLRQAAADPAVVAIKQTLYRTDEDVVGPLLDAARRGKDVTVVLELEARDNEWQNVALSRALQEAGARVVYGIVGLKVHAKLLLVVRRENGRLREYANFSTGNYHPGNARHYSDLSLFTADADIARDLTRVFNYITGNLDDPQTASLVVAPGALRRFLLDSIAREAANARRGRPAGIWLKLNSLVDTAIIDALYAAAASGVPIRAMVRRHCALRPGVPGLSRGIEVRSLVGRYLEHARIVCFANGALLPSHQACVYLSSADWMPRNFDDRVEVLVPVKSPSVRRMLLEHVMAANWRDTAHTWTLEPDGSYRPPTGQGFCAQSYFAATPWIG